MTQPTGERDSADKNAAKRVDYAFRADSDAKRPTLQSEVGRRKTSLRAGARFIAVAHVRVGRLGRQAQRLGVPAVARTMTDADLFLVRRISGAAAARAVAF